MPQSVDFYLSKGFDATMAAYFASGRKRIVAVVPNDDFTLLLTFDNDEQRIFDVKPFLKKGTVFEQFLQPSEFRRVYLDNDHCVCWDKDPAVDSEVVWNNKVDISPDVCYVDSIPVENKTLQ